MLCQITSKSYGDARAIQLAAGDFIPGSLRVTSFVRPDKLFTAQTSLVAGHIGGLQAAKFSSIRDAVVRLIQPATWFNMFPATEFKKRKKAWKAPKPRYPRGVLAKYPSQFCISHALAALNQSVWPWSEHAVVAAEESLA